METQSYNKRILIMLLLSFCVVVFTLLVTIPALSATPRPVQSGNNQSASVWLREVSAPMTPTATLTPTVVVTLTQTAVATQLTVVPTETKTPVPPTPTPPTPTVTGTPPTPTATGTITPNPTVAVSVSPSEAKINESLTFTVRITNAGTKPITTGIVSNAFPSYIDVLTVTTSQGTVTKALHSYTVNIGGLDPNDVATIIAIVRVNSSLTRTELVTNQVILSYDNNLTRTGSVIYRVVATTLIPGTGQISLVAADRLEAARSLKAWLDSGWVFLILGAGSFLGLAGRRRAAVLKAIRIPILVALALILAACLANSAPEQPVQQPETAKPTSTPTLLPFRPASAFSTPEVIITLPVYPIPTPVVENPQDEGEPALDTSPVQRIVIPALSLDTVVAYVPYDENSMTWLIQGLREEVAWLGETSWPGLGSNTVVAGHVTVSGLGNGPFRYLENLKAGDQIKIYTDENEYVYTMREQVTVNETDLAVMLPTTHPQLTLITCTGWDTELEIYRFRRVVFADLLRTEAIIRQGSH